MRRHLTDRTIKALKPASPGQRYEVIDTDTPGLCVRVNDKGVKTFGLIARFPGGSNHPTRRSLGEYGDETEGKVGLAGARKKTREWRELIRQGIDPAEIEERKRQVEAQRRANSFAAVAED